MKRKCILFLIMVVANLAMAGIHTYTSESVLSEGRWIKISVKETGIHMISYETLKGWGIQPENVAIVGYGGGILSENFTEHHWDDLPPVAFYMHKGTDGVFNAGDYLLFYAQGPTIWKYDLERGWYHKQNTYSDYGYYFVTDKLKYQHLMSSHDAQYDAVSQIDVDWYTALCVHEKDSFNLIDLSGQSGGGREFYGEYMNLSSKNRTITFPLKNVKQDISTRCVVDMAASSGEATLVQVNYAGTTQTIRMSAISVTDNQTKATKGRATIIANAQSADNQQVQLQLNNTKDTKAFLNYVEMQVPCELTMTGEQMAITNTQYVGQSESMLFRMKGASANIQIWRVNDGVNIERMVTSNANGELTWVGPNTQIERYIAVNVGNKTWKEPQMVAQVDNQNLHALSNVDYVIISPKDLLDPAIRLAKKHEEIDHMTWAVVTDEQVYNEFSSGTPDATAYRWLMKMLYDRANGDAVQTPKNLLLMGDGTYDNRKRFPISGPRMLLTYQADNSVHEAYAYATDDYFGFLSDDAGIHQGTFMDSRARMDIGVGRLPVKSLEEANQVVDKLCTYMDDRVLGKWKSEILFLADDGDRGTHVKTADDAAEVLRKKNKDFLLHKIYLDAYTQEVSASGETYPLAKNQFENLMNNGVLFMNYSGHGGYNNITSELLMKSADIQRMSNTNLGFWFLATCSFSHFDGGVTSAGEYAVLNPNGGAVGVLSACRTVYATQNTELNINICDTLFGHSTLFDYNMTLGEATRMAKNITGYDSNKMPYVLLGDPAIRLNYPTDLQIRIESAQDTMHALDLQTIRGYIQSRDGDTAHWFNGKLDATILDKMQEVLTRDNDQLVEENKTKLLFNDYPNTLFAGKADVKGGVFEFSFIVPKDIRYNYGAGRIVCYAYDVDTREEAVGHFEDFVIGGSSSLIQKDSLGPDMHIYLNNPAFQSGDVTYEYPHFYADIIDSSGINTVGTGIGHDLLLVIDADPKQTYILNNYFSSSNGSYQAGQVSYKMPEQTEGAHTLSFRAWDMYNNSSTQTLNYQVVKGIDPHIYSVTTYPNPVSCSGNLTVNIQYDQPNEAVETVINVYDVSGQLVYVYKQNGVNGIVWNMSEVVSSPGIYVYQVNIKTVSSSFVSKAGKIIVTK